MHKNSLQEKKAIVINFLNRCNLYAEEKITVYEKELLGNSDSKLIFKLNEKKHSWSSYFKFNNHAIGELKTKRLDAWFLSSN